MKLYRTADWLPTTRKEAEQRGWESLDVIIFSADAYVDHPSFGAAVIARVLEAKNLRVAIVPQPNWRDDLRDFTKMGVPKLFFAVSGGAMDSMVNKYTAGRRLRSEDAYTPDGRTDLRPEYPTVVYTAILKKLYPETPVIVGGIEASMRRLAHYDYWQNKLLPSIIIPSRADIIVYGNGEKSITEIVSRIKQGETLQNITVHQTVTLSSRYQPQDGDKILHSYEQCIKNSLRQAENFKTTEEETLKIHAGRLIQQTGDRYVIINPQYPHITTPEIDAVYDLPYTRLPHPKYSGKRIPAYETIRHSVTIHRGCFGGCAFCTISAHQGKHIISRSPQSILNEVTAITNMPDFKGYVSDLGGPSANMYGMRGKNLQTCERCIKPSCIHPAICRNLNVDHRPLTELYRAAGKIPGIKKTIISSGVRYDLLVNRYDDNALNIAAADYTRELIVNHVSGRLKVAPEHTSDRTLACIRKPPFADYIKFSNIFYKTSHQHNLNQQLQPYFISSHPACTEIDMAELAVITKTMNLRPEQIQDFTPTPMTLSTTIFHTGVHPFSHEKPFVARTADEKQRQRQYFFWHDKTLKEKIIQSLKKLHRPDIIIKLFGKTDK
ncbi:MAG: YgiQ family radical SAM protein [Dysgonamonadaceae bacterium]|jgi:uncharacterized radical SAM protein YgiQ|nr:YgiQ family radical SAM protein [Dysgonamonadaceae bacterium]